MPRDRDTGRRRRRRQVVIGSVVLTAALSLAAAACGSSSPSEGALQGKTATQIISQSLQAFHSQPAVHYVTKTVVGTVTTTQSGSTSGSAADEAITTGKTPVLDAVLTGGTAYLRASARTLQNVMNLSPSNATAQAGKWVSFQKGDPGYNNVVQSLKPSEAIAIFVPEEPGLKVAGATQLAGRPAVAVEGTTAGQLTVGATGVVTMFVSTTAPYLPLGATLVVKYKNGQTIERAASVYGKYNTKVDPTAPTGATPASTLHS